MNKPFDETETDAPATPEEQAQAEALAHELERAGSSAASSEHDSAALLRQAHGNTTALEERALAYVLPALQARRKTRRWLIVPAILIPATAGLLLLVLPTMARFAPAPTLSQPPLGLTGAPSVYANPAPSSALLQAQASAARGDRQAFAALDAQMRHYRAEFYRSLEGR
jgi:hypothetical protein